MRYAPDRYVVHLAKTIGGVYVAVTERGNDGPQATISVDFETEVLGADECDQVAAELKAAARILRQAGR